MTIQLKACPRCGGDVDPGRNPYELRCVQCGYSGAPILWADPEVPREGQRWVRMSPDPRAVFHRFDVATRALLCGRNLTGDTLDPYVDGDPLCGVCERLHTAKE